MTGWKDIESRILQTPALLQQSATGSPDSLTRSHVASTASLRAPQRVRSLTPSPEPIQFVRMEFEDPLGHLPQSEGQQTRHHRKVNVGIQADDIHQRECATRLEASTLRSHDRAGNRGQSLCQRWVAKWLQDRSSDRRTQSEGWRFTGAFSCWRGRARTSNLLIQSQAFCH
jgi:hypothetical protein